MRNIKAVNHEQGAHFLNVGKRANLRKKELFRELMKNMADVASFY